MNYLFVVLNDPNRAGKYLSTGTAYVAASLRKNTNHRCFGLNFCFEIDPMLALERSLSENNIDVLCIGELSASYMRLKSAVSFIREKFPEIIIVIGGGIITSQPDVVIKELNFDYGVNGAGEETICELAMYIENYKKRLNTEELSKINGLVWKDENGAIIVNAERRNVIDINEIPFPAYELFGLDKFLRDYDMVIGLSRSCTHNCTFCFHTSGNKYAQRKLTNVFDEIDHWLTLYPAIHSFALIDELCGNDVEYLRELAEGMRNRNLTFTMTLRVDIVTDDLICLLRENGCRLITYGLESADDRILRSMRKGITLSQIENALAITHKHGVGCVGNFIFGDVEETPETVKNTLSWWFNHLEYDINLNLLIAYPGTKIYKHAIDKGIIKDKIKFLEEGCPAVNISKLSDDEFNMLSAKIALLNSIKSDVGLYNYCQRDNADYLHDVEYVCPQCRQINRFHDALLFFGRFYYCEKCNRALNLQWRITESLDQTVGTLKVVIWAITQSSDDFIEYAKTSRHVEVVGVVDGNPELHGKEYKGFTIDSPSNLNNYNFDRMFIGSRFWRDEIKKQYEQMDLKKEVIPL